MQEFEVRRATLFASLDNAANDIGHKLKQTSVSNIRAINNRDNNVNEHERNVIEDLQPSNRLGCIRGRGSIFLRPEAPINKCLRSHRLPDYQRNPHKWKKYSLADADDSDLANRVGALMFLQKIANAKSIKNDLNEVEDQEADLNEKMEFNQRKTERRHSMAISNSVEDEERKNSQIKDGKVVMPEYVIGKHLQNKSKKTSKSQGNVTTRAVGKLTLSHLQEDEEE